MLEKMKLVHAMVEKVRINLKTGIVPPFLTNFQFNSDGVKQPDVPIFTMIRPVFLHDFAITKKYDIFADIQIERDGRGDNYCSIILSLLQI